MVRQIAFLLLLSLPIAAFGQAPPKRTITSKDYDNWHNANGMTLSPDGKWIAYNLYPSEGDGALVIRNLSSNVEHRIPRAGRPAAPATPEGGETPAPGPVGPGGRPGGFTAGGSPIFSPDSSKLFITLPPSKAETDKAKEQKAEAPRTAFVVIDVNSGKIVERIDRVRSYSILGEKPGYLVMQMDPKPEPKVEDKPKTEEKPKTETKPKTEEKPKAGPMPKSEVKPAANSKEVLPNPKPIKPDVVDGVESEDDDQAPAGQPPTGRGQGGGRGPRGAGQGPGAGAGAGTGGPAGGAPSRRAVGFDIVMRNLQDGKETKFTDIVEYSITKDAKQIVYTTSVKKDEGNTIAVNTIPASASAKVIQSGKMRFYRLVWDAKQTSLAFFAEEVVPAEKPATPATGSVPSTTPAPGAAPAPTTTPTPTPAKPPTVMIWDRAKGDVRTVITPATPGVAKGMKLTDRSLSFSTDGTKLSLTVIPEPVPTPPATTPAIPAADKVDLDLWHWKDEYIQPMQKIRAAQERNKSYPAVYFLDSKTIRQIGTEELTVSMPGQSDWSIGTDDRKYRYLTGYGANLRDTMFVNVRTGESKLIWPAFFGRLITSPNAKSALTFDGKDWWSISLPEGKKVNLTAKLPVAFFNEEHDTPDEAPPYGQPQWTSDEKTVLLPDRYDIWKISLDGTSVENLTKIGRELKTQLRLLRISDTPAAAPTPAPGVEPPAGAEAAGDGSTGFDLSKTWLLSAENLHTRDTGFYRLEPGQKPKLLVMAARKFGSPVQSKSGDTFLLTAQTFSDYPDYYVTDKEFKEIRKVTDIQPNVRDFNWGKAELIHYTTVDGKPLSGILVKPENFDSTKKYPMVVYIYERLSQNLHSFTSLPMVTRGQVINPAVYASNGYVVLMPDIAYSTGEPGPSAIKCVMPAIQAVVDRGYINESAIGINGQSWGGYQIAYMVTQTNRFKAAVAGAAVTNMVSAYGGIRWGSGLPREFQYERTQSRIGATLWQAPMRYIENSPVFMADRVKTPLLMINNDKDDAVPWYQGIEFYLALRRLGREVYMLNYIDEVHNLRKKANARDFSIRMMQFFDHHLKGAPMPEWMSTGVPYLEREKEKERLGK